MFNQLKKYYNNIYYNDWIEKISRNNYWYKYIVFIFVIWKIIILKYWILEYLPIIITELTYIILYYLSEWSLELKFRYKNILSLCLWYNNFIIT